MNALLFPLYAQAWLLLQSGQVLIAIAEANRRWLMEEPRRGAVIISMAEERERRS